MSGSVLLGVAILVVVVVLVVLAWRWGTNEAPARPRERRVRRIRRSVLELIAESARHTHPNEFAGVLRAEGDTIVELLLAPNAIQGNRHAIFSIWNMPVDTSIVGTVHSHPSSVPLPSYADRQFFSSAGNTHIIMAMPYTLDTWRAYDGTGADVHLEVVEG